MRYQVTLQYVGIRVRTHTFLLEHLSFPFGPDTLCPSVWLSEHTQYVTVTLPVLPASAANCGFVCSRPSSSGLRFESIRLQVFFLRICLRAIDSF